METHGTFNLSIDSLKNLIGKIEKKGEDTVELLLDIDVKSIKLSIGEMNIVEGTNCNYIGNTKTTIINKALNEKQIKTLYYNK